MKRFTIIFCLFATALLATQSVKTVNGLAIASVKTMDQLAIASVKTVAGLDNTSSGGYDPGADSRVVAWWEGDAITGSDGDAVGTWPDSDDSANDATQATAGAKPSLQTNELNGHSVVRFDGGDGLLISSIVDSTQTICFVAKNTSTTSYNVLVSTGTGSNAIALLTHSAAKWGMYDTSFHAANSAISTTFVVGSLVRDGVDNSFFLSGASDGTASQSSSSVFAQSSIGNDNFNSSFIGDCAEIIVYNINLDSTDRAAVEAYLATKYGL